MATMKQKEKSKGRPKYKSKLMYGAEPRQMLSIISIVFVLFLNQLL